ncbi:MAG: ribonuclease III [Erysipelotrichaceae bacterium]|nr:ribonuclease III [Erysipelotrichaceae bacterium]
MNIYEWLRQHGVEVETSQLIDDAFTHTSYMNEHKQTLHDNERLEFMGDAVMQIWVSERLFNIEPAISEGRMTTMRAQMVCEKSFAMIMRELKLTQFIRLGVGEEKNGGRNKDSIIADAFEAFVGALYLTKGMEAVNKILDPVFEPLLNHPELTGIVDYKTKLQEYAQSDIRKSVKYVMLSEKGPSNNPVFEMGVYLDDILLGKGTASNKKQAEQNAAKEALKILVK